MRQFINQIFNTKPKTETEIETDEVIGVRRKSVEPKTEGKMRDFRMEREKLMNLFGTPTYEKVRQEVLTLLPDAEIIEKYKDAKLGELINYISNQNPELLKSLNNLSPEERGELFDENKALIKETDETEKMFKSLPAENQAWIEKNTISDKNPNATETRESAIIRIYEFRKQKNHPLNDPEKGGLYGIHISRRNLDVNTNLSCDSDGKIFYSKDFNNLYTGKVGLKEGAHIYIIEKTANDELIDQGLNWYTSQGVHKIIDKIDLPKVSSGDQAEAENEKVEAILNILRAKAADAFYK